MLSLNRLVEQKTLERVLSIFALCAFAVAQPVYDMLLQYPEFFVARQSNPSELMVFILLLSVGIPAAVSLAGLIVGKINRVLGVLYTLAAIGVLACLFVLPIVKQQFVESGNYVLLAATLLFAIIVTGLYALSSTARSFTSILSFSVLAFPLIFVADAQIQKIMFSGGDESIVASAAQPTITPPIIFMIFDELPYTALLKDDGLIDEQRYPNIAQLAAHSNWFTNATAVSDGTVYAVPAILSGRYPSEDLLPSIADYPGNIFTWLGGTYSINAIESATRLCPDSICAEVGPNKFRDRLRSLLVDVYYIYLHLVLPPTLTAGLPDISQGWGDFDEGQAGTRMEDFTDMQGWLTAVRKVFKVDRMSLFDRFLEQIGNDEKPSVHFLHMLFPHVPYEFFPSGKRYMPNDLPKVQVEKWLDDTSAAQQGHQRFILQLGYLDRMIGRLVAHLRDRGLYDEALIVITADHGVGFQADDFRRPLTERNTADILPVPLIIKEPHQAQGKVWHSNVETIDILPSIADLLGAKPPDFVEGVSVFAQNRQKTDRKRFYSYRSRETIDFPEVLPGVRQALQRKLDLLGSGSDPLRLYALGPYGHLVGSPVDQLDIADDMPFSSTIDQSLMLQSVVTAGDVIPARLTGTLGADKVIESAVDMAVAVNGTLVATFRTFDSEPERFAVMVPEESLIDGENTIELFSIAVPGGRVVLARTNEVRGALRTNWQTQPLIVKEFEDSARTVFLMDEASLDKFTMLNELVANKDGGTLELNSSGGDPYLLLPEFPLAKGSWHLLRLKLESPVATQLQIYYKRNEQANYNGADSLISNIAAGENEIYLKIWETGTAGRIRLDPGMSDGIYRLREVEVRAVEAPRKKEAQRITREMYPDIKQRFQAAGDALFQLKPETISQLRLINELSASPVSTGLTLIASGSDPYLQLPEVLWPEDRIPLIRIRIDSPAVSQLQVYYQVRNDMNYKESRSVVTNLQEGPNDVYLEIRDADLAGQLRLDPGMVIGEYTIHSLDVRSDVRNSHPPH